MDFSDLIAIFVIAKQIAEKSKTTIPLNELGTIGIIRCTFFSLHVVMLLKTFKLK